MRLFIRILEEILCFLENHIYQFSGDQDYKKRKHYEQKQSESQNIVLTPEIQHEFDLWDSLND